MLEKCDPFEALSPELACEVLAEAGFEFERSDVEIEAHEARWLVRLPGQLLAWFAASENGVKRLQVERRVLRLVDARCTFRVPRVLFESAAGAFDVRSMIPGASDPSRIYGEVRDSVDRAVGIGDALGTILAEQHSRIGAADVAGWLPRRPAWPESREWVVERLHHVVDDSGLIASAGMVMDAYEGVVVAEADRALVHTDVAFHNLGIDLGSQTVHGLFDYEGAAWADRHHDFRYLVLDVGRSELLEAALSTYEPLAGQSIQRDRVFLYHAACAVTFLACRAGTDPGERAAGRTLDEDLRWSKDAIARVLKS